MVVEGVCDGFVFIRWFLFKLCISDHECLGTSILNFKVPVPHGICSMMYNGKLSHDVHADSDRAGFGKITVARVRSCMCGI